MIIDELKNRIKELEGENLTLHDSCVELDMKVMQLEAQTQWQPIETAPKDDREIFVGIDKEGRCNTCYNEGWAILENQEGIIIHPTHWMPLPKPPEES